MGSMKSGVGDDPFADEDSGEDTEEDVDELEADPTPKKEETVGDSTIEEPTPEPDTMTSESPNTTETMQQPTTTAIDSVDVVDSVPHEDKRIPFIMSRQSVKGSRDGKTLQIALNTETQGSLEEAVRQIQRVFDDDVKKMDITEAILLAGLMNLGDVDSVLRTWGYDFSE